MTPASEPLVPGAAAASQRLAEQLSTLTEVVETITYRLLELEERVAAQQQRLEALGERNEADSDSPAAVQSHLDHTEARLAGIESMLSGNGGPETAISLSLVPDRGRARADGPAPEGFGPGEGDIDGPFPEEPEQEFLDDLEGTHEQGFQPETDLPPGCLTA